MINRFTFPVDTDSPYAVKRMAEHLQTGGKLVLFPEGRLSRTGEMMKLYEGTGFLLFKTGAKVVTCYLRGANRLPFSPNPEPEKMVPARHRPFQRRHDAAQVDGHEHHARAAKAHPLALRHHGPAAIRHRAGRRAQKCPCRHRRNRAATARCGGAGRFHASEADLPPFAGRGRCHGRPSGAAACPATQRAHRRACCPLPWPCR